MKGDINVDEVFRSPDAVRLDESDRLRFAKQILVWLGVICVGVFAAYAASPENKALSNIFEVLKVGAFPLVTLVISFYFPSAR